MSRATLPSSFRERVVIVTGAGRGLGRAYALGLAARGARVLVNDIGDDGLLAAATVKTIEEHGGTALASMDSVATTEGGAAVVAAALAEFGGVDAVVHNAGGTWSGSFEDATDADIERVLGVHVHGAFAVLRPAWRHMRERGYGRVVLTSSSAATFGRDAGSLYSTAKGALLGLGRALALEGAPHGIVVNTILPYAQTGILGDNPLHGGSVTQRILTLLGKIYARGLPPEDVVPLVAYLASDLCLDGGHVYWACAGQYAEAFVGLTSGWAASAEDSLDVAAVAQHLPEIQRRDAFSVPRSIADELELVLARLDRSGSDV
jgi:NAD(P)-dependent dehydrogenase (short-subunit alcohol dehydrogenase family)